MSTPPSFNITPTKKKTRIPKSAIMIYIYCGIALLVLACCTGVPAYFNYAANRNNANDAQAWSAIGSQALKMRADCPEDAPLQIKGKVIALRYDQRSGKRFKDFVLEVPELVSSKRAGLTDVDGDLTVVVTMSSRREIAEYVSNEGKKVKQYGESATAWAFHWPEKKPICKKSFRSSPPSKDVVSRSTQIQNGDVDALIRLWIRNAAKSSNS